MCNIIRRVALATVMAATGFCQYVAAAGIDYSYNESGMEWMSFGFGKLETYDVAIRLSDPLLEGASVTGLKVPVGADGNKIKDVSVWVSSELRLEKKVNAPDIFSQPAEIDEYGFINVSFDTECVIPENGLYVGYSLTVAELDERTYMPVALVYADNPDGFYLHTSRSQMKWTAYGSMFTPPAVSAMTVCIEGDFEENAVGVAAGKRHYLKAGEQTEIEVTLVNHGMNPIAEISYEYSLADIEQSGNVQLPTPLEGRYGATATIAVPVPPLSEKGTFMMEFKVTALNSVPNHDNTGTAIIPVVVMPFVPVNRPLVEEYTGTWCAYCPRGYVALEEMNEKYGHDFVAVAIHDSDDMAVLTSYPSAISGLPAAVINRGEEIDPTFIAALWDSERTKSVPADIDVDIEFVTESVLKAVSTVRFVGDELDTDYRIAYMLVNDGLQNDRWRQQNAYAGSEGYYGKWWDIFTQATGPVGGLVYNDVLVACSELDGITGSLPADIIADTPLEHSYCFDIDNIVNIKGNPVIQDSGKLRVVALLINGATGQVVNCNTSPYPEISGVEEVFSADEISEVKYYDVNGIETDLTHSGLIIRKIVLKDGRRLVNKIIRL